MGQKVVRITEATLPDGKSFGWNLDVALDRIVGLINPPLGAYQHAAVVDDSGKFLYDIIRKLDGPVQDDGHATPSAIMVVVEERPDGMYLYCQEETRPVIFDHVNNQQGVIVTGFAGGFTKKGAKPSDTALEELLEEQGVQVDKATVERIGWASDNRATTETCIEVYLGVFSRKVAATPGEHEIILKTKAIRIDQFRTGRDGIVNNAYGMAVEHLGLVMPKPLNPLVARFAALADEDSKAAEALLYMLERSQKK